VHKPIQLLIVAPKKHGNVNINRKGKHVIHRHISQHASCFSPGGKTPKTCLVSVTSANSQ